MSPDDGRDRTGEVEVVGTPRSQCISEAFDRQIGHHVQDVEARVVRDQHVMFGRQLHDPQTQVTDPLERRRGSNHRDDQPKVGRHRVLAHQHLVALLDQRHVHRVDVVVGRNRAFGRGFVAGQQHLTHALEVLIHEHTHDLGLQLQLLEIGGEVQTKRLPRLSRTGR